MKDKDYLCSYYDSYNEDGRLTLYRRGKLEYITTMHYVQTYLKPGNKILEIGAGTGRYSIALATQGYDVTAVELVSHNLDVLRSKITPDMNIQVLEGNALHLDMLPDEAFDMTLLLGPLYHLFQDAKKQQAIAEALRVTKRGGIVMAAYCIAEGSIVEYAFKQNHLDEVLAEGMLDPETFSIISKPSDLFEMVRKSDIDHMMADFPVTRLHYVATDGLSYFMRKELEEMEETTFQTFVKYHLTICENPDLVGATAHSLDIFRKESRVISLYSGENL